MADWGRDTPWRQGRALTKAAAKALNLVCPRNPEETIVVVVSHDCDLAQPPSHEPSVEAIIGCVVASAAGNLTHAKNVRRIHLPFRCGEREVVVDLSAAEKITIPKADLVPYLPREDLTLESVNLSILQNWLAARYRRAAFPDEFDRRLEESGMREKLAKILKANGSQISAVFFDVDEGEEIDRRGSREPFVLDIYLVHTTSPNPRQSEDLAVKAKSEIEKAFAAKLNSDGSGWKEIELRICEVISDEVLTHKQSQLMKQWRQDHISLREDPPQAMISP